MLQLVAILIIQRYITCIIPPIVSLGKQAIGVAQ